MKKNSIVVDGVTYYAEHPDLTKAKQALEKWEWIKSDILSTVEQSQRFYDKMKDDGLTFSTIEAEGYLRCAKTLKNTIEMIEQSFEE